MLASNELCCGSCYLYNKIFCPFSRIFIWNKAYLVLLLALTIEQTSSCRYSKTQGKLKAWGVKWLEE